MPQQHVGGDEPNRPVAGLDSRRAASDATPPPHVLVCLDRSALAETALPHALALARSCGARVTLLHVLEPDHAAEALPIDPLAWEIRGAEGRHYLESLATRHQTAGVAIETALVQGHAAEQISAWAAAHHVDFTVLCTHGEGGRTEWRLASTAQKLIEGVAGCVLLVPASAPPPAGAAFSYARIVVPLDGSARAESAVPLAIRVARAHGAELILAHVVPAPELTRTGPLTPNDLELERRLVRRNEEVARAYLDRLRVRVQETGLAVRTVLALDHDTRSELVRIVAREQADLVILSAHGSSGRVDQPCGSVATHLLAQCTTPLLVVRERDRTAAQRRDPLAERRRASARMPALAAP